ncbi:hypothetical protein MHBO_004238 [Bonamia ostreae]|uniref:Major facilitator superfamily associated domain-containing protein n=1 Tax=Bonamia ostreae TaxID=126728 RepID=A0ABV2ASR2_9EUKA
MVPFMRSWIRAKNYVTYCLPFLALIYMLIGDYPIDKTSLGYETYNVVTYILLIFRDWIFWMSYVLCNVVIMEGIVLKNQGIELNGFCAALYLFSFNFGDAAGLLLGNVVFKMYGYNIVTFSTMILLCVGFVTILIIRFWKKIKNFFSSLVN